MTHSLPSKLGQYTGAPSPTYRTIWSAVVNEQLPMVQQQNGRWYFRDADLAAIADALDITIAA